MGAIEKGMWADWVVIDRELGTDDGKELRDVVVKETWVAGRRVFPIDNGLVEESWFKKVYGAALKFVEWTRGNAGEEL